MGRGRDARCLLYHLEWIRIENVAITMEGSKGRPSIFKSQITSSRDETQHQDCSYCPTSCFSLRIYLKLHHTTQSVRCYQYSPQLTISARPLFVKGPSTRIIKTSTISFKRRLGTQNRGPCLMHDNIDPDAARFYLMVLMC